MQTVQNCALEKPNEKNVKNVQNSFKIVDCSSVMGDITGELGGNAGERDGSVGINFNLIKEGDKD